MHIIVFLTFIDTCIRFKSTQMLTAQVMLKGLQKDRMDWIKELFLNYVLLFNIKYINHVDLLFWMNSQL
jgi:hypothetical protein